MYCTGKRRLGVDDPPLSEELMDEAAEAMGLSEADDRAVELELFLVKELCEPVTNLRRKTRLSTWTGRKKRGEVRASRSDP